MFPRRILGFLYLAALLGSATTVAIGGSHTWRINEIFSNADGTIQFIEMREDNGGEFEGLLRNETIASNANVFTIPRNVLPPTSFKHLLFATPGFAALPGAPTPDFVIPANFFSVAGDTISYSAYDARAFGPGVLPTDGVHSINRNLAVTVNSPKNYAGNTGSVDASPQPPGVPDGTNATTPMTVIPLDLPVATLSIAWDTTTCTGGSDHHIIYGQGNDLPSAPGMPFTPLAGVCSMGTTSPFVWNNVPTASDGSGLLWWIIVANNGSTTEGSWGTDSAGAERRGPGAGGMSGVCGITSKSLSNTCGH